MVDSNETMWNPSDAAKKDAPRAESSGGKTYDVPFKVAAKGTIAIQATSKKGALAQARKLFKGAVIGIGGADKNTPLPTILLKKSSVKPTKK